MAVSRLTLGVREWLLGSYRREAHIRSRERAALVTRDRAPARPALGLPWELEQIVQLLSQAPFSV